MILTSEFNLSVTCWRCGTPLAFMRLKSDEKDVVLSVQSCECQHRLGGNLKWTLPLNHLPLDNEDVLVEIADPVTGGSKVSVGYLENGAWVTVNRDDAPNVTRWSYFPQVRICS